MRFFNLVLPGILLVATNLTAQEDTFKFRKEMRHTGEKIEGLSLDGSFTVPISYGLAKSRLGIADGHYLELAGRLKTALHYTSGDHDWSTSLYLAEAYTMTPAIKNQLVKSEDVLQFETRYLYNLATFMGVFAHARLSTSIAKGIDIHDKEVEYELHDEDNKLIGPEKHSSLKLTDAFFPIFLSENIGLFITPVSDPMFTWEARAAASFRQTFANQQKVLVEEKDEKFIVRDLFTFYQIGPAVGSSISGKLFSDVMSFHAGIDAMWPAWQSPKKSDRTFVDSLIVEASAGIGYEFSSYASLNYEYATSRIPDILEKFQHQHIVNLNVHFNWDHNFGG